MTGLSLAETVPTCLPRSPHQRPLERHPHLEKHRVNRPRATIVNQNGIRLLLGSLFASLDQACVAGRRFEPSSSTLFAFAIPLPGKGAVDTMPNKARQRVASTLGASVR